MSKPTHEIAFWSNGPDARGTYVSLDMLGQPKGSARSPLGNAFVHLPYDGQQALDYLERIQLVNARAAADYYSDRLILVTYVEKSANTTISDCIARIQLRLGPDRGNPPPDYGVRRQPEYVRAFDDHALRPELLLYRPNGGVVNRMIAPNASNLAFLDWVGARYFVVLRHPVDQIAAMFTYLPERITGHWANNPILPMPWHLYESGADQQTVIAHLINEGYLLSLLKYIGDWLEKRDAERSQILRFEDFVRDKRSFFGGIGNFLYAAAMDDALVEELDVLAGKSHDQRKAAGNEARRYTKGSTDRTEIWRNYFSAENLRDYRAMVERVLAAYPPARRILEIYPDLIPD
jgi:hypothetical protein